MIVIISILYYNTDDVITENMLFQEFIPGIIKEIATITERKIGVLCVCAEFEAF